MVIFLVVLVVIVVVVLIITVALLLLLLLLLLSLSPLYKVFTRMSLRQTMSLGDRLLQLLFRFIVSKVCGVYLPRSCVGSDGIYYIIIIIMFVGLEML